PTIIVELGGDEIARFVEEEARPAHVYLANALTKSR
ncbi:MAG: thioredoxin, partial [Halobacteriaceae archaeon]